jgi:hypothetical protein
MQSNPLYAECILRAAIRLGGYRALGARIGVPPRLLERWGDGRGAVPETVFLKVVDVLLEQNVRPIPPLGDADGRPFPIDSPSPG